MDVELVELGKGDAPEARCHLYTPFMPLVAVHFMLFMRPALVMLRGAQHTGGPGRPDPFDRQGSTSYRRPPMNSPPSCTTLLYHITLSRYLPPKVPKVPTQGTY